MAGLAVTIAAPSIITPSSIRPVIPSIKCSVPQPPQILVGDGLAGPADSVQETAAQAWGLGYLRF